MYPSKNTNKFETMKYKSVLTPPIAIPNFLKYTLLLPYILLQVTNYVIIL